MPLINYAVLSELVDELETLAALPAPDADQERRRADAEYTLCICTGVHEPQPALVRARALLAGRQREAAAMAGAAPVAAA
ncbi:DUF5133 domain-containing protein [Kitasatospora sp. NBC_01539]|uniref:DUF5133 domain-containing protein n=1 Tax=Kitasatospora sp. NBC_01539 TaxID=2903577 RepID=UPI003860213A